MRILIDSHVLLWALNDSHLLGKKVTALLSDGTNDVYVSVASLWELALKHTKGKLPYTPEELLKGVEGLHFLLLPITAEDITALETIVLPHKDPFDTLLVAQTVVQGFTFITADANILTSPYTLLDASK